MKIQILYTEKYHTSFNSRFSGTLAPPKINFLEGTDQNPKYNLGGGPSR